MYHYTECGLDNVWLINGFTVETIDGEEFVSFEEADDLHAAIGRTLASKPNLTAAEFKFLRKELGLSQKRLADMLGTSEQTISLWERGSEIPKSTERLLKLVYLDHLDGNVKVHEMISRLLDLDAKEASKFVFEDTKAGWRVAA
ncbi:helix-turn-helix transcriptional regulator [Pigmentiphaga soli]|uniref:Helix-turn-helix transcriptional regulator n=1 Tax=Pigmentiphaga soli TaxID=1007095 RepID=A0ABP8H649_9BURK